MRVLLSIAAALTLLTITGACTPPGQGDDAEADAEEEEPATLVETSTITTAVFEDYIEIPGVTEGVRSATISAEVPGRITRLNLTEGEYVAAGTTVLRIDASQLGSQVEQYRIELDHLDTEIRRTERLIERGLATQAQLDSLNAQRNATRQAMRTTSIGYGQARTRAPISGLVVERNAEPGEIVAPGVPIGRIVDLSTIVVRVGLPEREIAHVREGMQAVVRIEATDTLLVGELAEIGLEANPRNRTFPLEIRIDNSEGNVRAGMRARVFIEKRRYEDAVVIPRDVIVQGIENVEVFVARDGLAHAVPIELGPGYGRFAVVDSGLSAGDVVVVRGQRDIVEGERLRTVDQGPCCAEQLAALYGSSVSISSLSATENSDTSN